MFGEPPISLGHAEGWTGQVGEVKALRVTVRVWELTGEGGEFAGGEGDNGGAEGGRTAAVEDFDFGEGGVDGRGRAGVVVLITGGWLQVEMRR